MQGVVFNIQRFSLFDGPGVRTVVFLKGCPLRCKWCHNPEGLKANPQIMFNASRCIGCGDCAEACPNLQHIMKDGMHCFIRDNCVDCGKCAEGCYSNALTYTGSYMTAEEVIQKVKRDMPVYKESGGGMTLSGGEPLFQADFSLELLKLAKQEGITTCIETSGYGNSEKLTEIAKYTDRFLFDYKATGEEIHKELCGVSQKKILENLAIIDSLGVDVVLRCPIIPELNENEEHIKGIADIAGKFNCVVEVQLEPYHRLGISKSQQLGVAAEYEGQAPDKDAMNSYCETIAQISGKKTTIS